MIHGLVVFVFDRCSATHVLRRLQCIGGYGDISHKIRLVLLLAAILRWLPRRFTDLSVSETVQRSVTPVKAMAASASIRDESRTYLLAASSQATFVREVLSLFVVVDPRCPSLEIDYSCCPLWQLLATVGCQIPWQ